MASGTINGSTGNQYIDSKIVWSSTKNDTANTSSVKATLYYKRNNTGYTTYGSGTFSITINGTKTSVTKTLTITESAWVAAVSNTITVNHNADGSKSITISATGSIPDTSLTSTSCGGTAKLDTIPRATTIDSLSCSTKYFTGTLTYKYTPQSSSYYNRCNIALNIDGEYTAVKSINLGKKSASQKTATVTLSESELSTIYNKLPKTTKGILRFTFRTYSDSGYSTQVGDALYKEITLYIPNDATTQPTVKMALSAVSSLGSDFSGIYVQGKSKVKGSFSGSSAKYGASISSYTMVVSGIGTYNGSSCQSGWLSKYGTITVTGTVKDSRGYSASVSKKITVISYAKPSLVPYTGEKAIICQRCTSNGTLSPSGTYLRIKAGRKYSKVVSGGSQKNFCTLRYKYKTESASSFSDWVNILGENDSVNETALIISGVISSISTSYMVQIGVIDDVGEEVIAEYTIPTAQVTLHLKHGGKGVGIGKYAENDNCLEIADDWDVTGRVYGLGKAKAEILSGADINNYKDFGVYAVVTNAIAATLSNLPTEAAGTLVVSSVNGTGLTSGKATYILQEYTTYTGRYRYRRMMSCNASNEWTYNAWVTEGDTGWTSLGLSSNVSSDASNCGRNGIGCFYKVVNGNHVYVAFNCAFTYSGSTIQVNSSMIPNEFRPARNVYAMCATGGRSLARVFVTSAGMVGVDWVQVITTTESTTSSTVKWVDGYIDYWV